MSNRDNADLVQHILDVLQPHQSGNALTLAATAAAIVHSLQGDRSLADNVSGVLHSSSGESCPLMLSLHQPPSSSRRFTPCGRRRKELKSYDMKLVIINFIEEVRR